MENIISNEKIDINKVQVASKIIRQLQLDIKSFVAEGSGPFVAGIYDNDGNLIIKTANSVVKDNNSNAHAEMKAIKFAEEKFRNYDLSAYDLKMYVTAEPCLMCMGGILWSGIKEIYYSVPSSDVEKITGFDEGFKPNWLNEFKKRGIIVYGNIESDLGRQELIKYVESGKEVYKPVR